MAKIIIHNLTKRYGEATALNNVSLEIESGEFLVLLGPSGCGKTTLLNIVAGFLAPTEGAIELNGNTVEGPGPERGMVFQQGALFEWMSVRDNVSFGPRMKGQRASEYSAEVDHLLDVCLLYTSPSPRDQRGSRMPSSA